MVSNHKVMDTCEQNKKCKSLECINYNRPYVIVT